jgi:hypothetical protein
MGLNGPARVVGIDPCPIIEPDDGTGRNVVTGTMAHPGANIVYLDITGLEEPLGVTDTHPIWSETRQDFVVAGQLEVGEQFRTVTGQSATLTKIHPHRGPPEMVFNLEVDGQHVYHVAGNGLLVHNACPWDEWKIGEHAIGPQPGHNWEKLLGGSEKTLENVKPYIQEVLEKGTWRALGPIREKGGKIIGEKVEAVVNINGADVWVTGLRDLAGKIILNNAGVK